MKEKGLFVSFGLGGHYIVVKGKYNGTLSGYDDPSSFITAMKAGRHVERDLEGAPVVDIREAIDRNPGLAYRAPMCGYDLEGDEVDRCPEPSDIMATAMREQGGSFGALLGLQALQSKVSKEPGPLDQVSPKRLVDYWKGHGARVGRIIGNEIIWEG
jgi:hypothetical protein